MCLESFRKPQFDVGGGLLSCTAAPKVLPFDMLPNLKVALIDTCGWGDENRNDIKNITALSKLMKEMKYMSTFVFVLQGSNLRFNT